MIEIVSPEDNDGISLSTIANAVKEISAQTLRRIPQAASPNSRVGIDDLNGIIERVNDRETNGIGSPGDSVAIIDCGEVAGCDDAEVITGNSFEILAPPQHQPVDAIPLDGTLLAKFKQLPMIIGSCKLGILVEGFKKKTGIAITNSHGRRYIVHSIKDCKLVEGVHWFRVRWDGYSEAQDTWEQESSVEENATPALSLHICEFFLKKSRSSPNFKGAASRYFRQYVRNGLLESKSPDYLVLARLANKELQIVADRILLPSTEDIACMRERIKTLLAREDYKSLFQKFGGELKNFVEFASKRLELRCHLTEWREKIAFKEPNSDAEIGIENYVDCEGLPADLNYVTDNIVSSNVGFLPPGEKSCSCRERGCFSEECCGTHSREGSKVLYPAYKRNRLNDPCQNVALYECNSQCSCGPSCRNRLIQQGCRLRLTIFRTCSRGWGIRADQRILKGTFIGEYVGELLTSSEAMKRHTVNFAFMFDLQPMRNEDAENTIDAARYGNFTRFLNHSCDPNVRAHYAYIENHHPAAPRVAFFAKRDIKSGEELVLDYRMHRTDGSGHLTSMRCHCGTSKCRGILF